MGRRRITAGELGIIILRRISVGSSVILYEFCTDLVTEATGMGEIYLLVTYSGNVIAISTLRYLVLEEIHIKGACTLHRPAADCGVHSPLADE